MLDWDKLRIFHVVAEAGSFTEAGLRLNCSQSAASRHIRALEDNLQVALFTRHARGLVLTQEGQHLLRTTRDVQGRIEETEHVLREAKDSPKGVLRVTTMVTFGAVWLTTHMKSFVEQYPDIELQLILDDEDLDLSSGQADVAIRLHTPVQADMIQRPLATFHNHIYASPEYLDRKGTPCQPSDLDHHDLIIYGSTAQMPLKNINWIMDIGKTSYDRTPCLQVNNLYGVMHAIEAGMGLGSLPDYLVHNRSNLVRVLPDMDSPKFPSFFCYPPELRGSKRVAVFRDFIIQTIKEESNIL